MLDFLLGVLLAVLLVRGWRRSLIPEAFDLLAVLVALAVSFRIAEPLGEAIAERFGGAPETVRTVVGLFVLVLVAVGAMTLSRALAARRRLRPDLAARVGGAVTGVLTGIVALAFVASTIRVLPLGAWTETMLDGSAVASRVVPRGGVVEEGTVRLVGDEVMEAVLALEPLIGERRIVVSGDQIVDLQPVEDDAVTQRPDLARDVEARVNAARLAAGGRPLAWSEGLAGIAAAHASEMYGLGMVARASPSTGSLEERIAASSIRLARAGDVVGLAATVSAFDSAVSLSPEQETVIDPVWDRMGVGVAEGPYGVLVVEVFGR